MLALSIRQPYADLILRGIKTGGFIEGGFPKRLLPRMTKLNGKWSLSDKFLVIRGGLRTYKIHLGSGNILMEPNDQYLCIVPDRSAATRSGDVFLPFEGDATLSIVLSKALMLADDGNIKDGSIVSQIKRR